MQKRRIGFLVIPIAALILALSFLIPTGVAWLNARRLEREGFYGQAALAYNALGGFPNASARSRECWRRHHLHRSLAMGSGRALGVRENGRLATTVTDFALGSWEDIVSIDMTYSVMGLQKDGTMLTASLGDRGRAQALDWAGPP